MPKVTIAKSHLQKLVENFQASPLQFYTAVEAALSRRAIPDSMIFRIDWHESGPLSVEREYLRVARGEHAVDICGAPFGTGFFFSTWGVTQRDSLGPVEIALLLAAVIVLPFALIYFLGFWMGMLLYLLGMPLGAIALVHQLNTSRPGWDDFFLYIPHFGPFYEHFIRPTTYYKMDTADMFFQTVHAAVVEVIDGMTEAKGIRGLSELDRKPGMAAAAGR